jgi:hypothetical protein
MCSLVLISLFFLFPETNAANILYKRAKRLRKATGDNRLKSQSKIDSEHHTARDDLRVLARAFILISIPESLRGPCLWCFVSPVRVLPRCLWRHLRLQHPTTRAGFPRNLRFRLPLSTSLLTMDQAFSRPEIEKRKVQA